MLDSYIDSFNSSNSSNSANYTNTKLFLQIFIARL